MVNNGDNAYIEKQNVLENHMDKVLLLKIKILHIL